MEQNKKIKLQITNMDKVYDNGDGVRGINMNVYEGEIVTMLGPSGCGKTTILRTIGGFLDVNAGDITINSKSIVHMPPEKRPTAMVFQSYNLWPHMTIFENLAFGLKLKKVPKQEIVQSVESMLKLVKMEGHNKKYPGQLSGGQQQRIAIARSLLLKPDVLLLDEPFSALDAKIRNQMRVELKRIQSELGITVVFVTHDQEEAMSISHRIIVMDKGHFEQVGSPTEIYDDPKTPFVASFIGEMNFWQQGDEVHAIRPEQVIVTKDKTNAALSGIIKTIMILGHYVELKIEAQGESFTSFLPREQANGLNEGDSVYLHFARQKVFDKKDCMTLEKFA